MTAYARWLFGAAAGFNAFLGVGLMLLRPLLERPLALEPLAGAGLMFSYLTGMLVAAMGVIYGLIATDPSRYRPLILMGVGVKVLAAVLLVVPRVGGGIPTPLPPVAVGAIVYAMLFMHYYWATRPKA